MRTRKVQGNLLISRRSVMRALGAAAIAGLPGCSDTARPPSTSPSPSPKTSGGYTDQQSYRPGDRVALHLSTNSPQSTTLFLDTYTGQPMVRIPVDLVTQPVIGANPWETGFGYQATTSFTLPKRPAEQEYILSINSYR